MGYERTSRVYQIALKKLDPQEIGGSYAGAFGYGQFIPSSYGTQSI